MTKKNTRITWKIEKRKIEDLKPHPKNPRQFTEKGMKDLEKSIKSIGFFQPVACNTDNLLLSGHARILKLKELGETEVDVMIPDRTLTPKQEEEVLVRANANTAGQWDFDILANQFDIDEITDWGLEVPNLENTSESENIEEIIEETKSIQQTTYNEFALFGRYNNYDIPVLKNDMLFDGNIDEVLFDKKQLDKDFKNKTFLCIEGGRQFTFKKNPHLLENNIVGFFADDEKFEKVWTNAVEMINFYKINKVKALLTPNFSMWKNEPKPFQIMAWYKTQWCGRFWQEAGLKIIPTLNFSDDESFEFCFLGVPKEAPMVFFQVRNVSTEKEIETSINGINEAYKRLRFKKAYLYGAGKTKKSLKILEGINPEINAVPFLSWTDLLTEKGW